MSENWLFRFNTFSRLDENITIYNMNNGLYYKSKLFSLIILKTLAMKKNRHGIKVFSSIPVF